MGEAGKKTQAGRHLPEYLVENIVARFPFPSILKARLLSKEWKSKFSFVARQSFLSWPEYFSYLHQSEVVRKRGKKLDKGEAPPPWEVVGYDVVVDSMKRMPVGGDVDVKGKLVCSDEVQDSMRPMRFRGTNIRSGVEVFACCGPLVVIVVAVPFTSLEATVTNVLTHQRRKIVIPVERRVDFFRVVLVPVGTDNYELLIWFYEDLYEDGGGTQIVLYDSRSGSCMVKPSSGSRNSFVASSVNDGAYKDGTFYFIPEKWGGYVLSLVQLNIESGAICETPIPVDEEEVILHYVGRCGSDIMAVLIDCRELRVLQLDIDSCGLVEVSRTPVTEEDWETFAYDEIFLAASSNRIYLTSTPFLDYEDPLFRIFDVKSKTWSSSSVPKEFSQGRAWNIPFVMELGLNPFVVP